MTPKPATDGDAEEPGCDCNASVGGTYHLIATETADDGSPLVECAECGEAYPVDMDALRGS